MQLITFATAWDYPDGIGIAYCLLTMALLSWAALAPLRRLALMAAGMALGDQGYYEIFGDPPRAFRDTASCGELPIEVCADRFEVKGLAARFVAGNMSYREP